MKYSILALFLISLLSFCNAQRSEFTSERLVGTWTFLEMRNNKGKKVKSYSNGYMIVNADGPTIVFNKEGTYKKIFTPENEDTGYWQYNANKKQINYDLYIDSTDWVGKDLIKNGEAQKYADGKYYEKLTDQVIRLTATELILNERGSQMVFTRKN